MGLPALSTLTPGQGYAGPSMMQFWRASGEETLREEGIQSGDLSRACSN